MASYAFIFLVYLQCKMCPLKVEIIEGRPQWTLTDIVSEECKVCAKDVYELYDKEDNK